MFYRSVGTRKYFRWLFLALVTRTILCRHCVHYREDVVRDIVSTERELCVPRAFGVWCTLVSRGVRVPTDTVAAVGERQTTCRLQVCSRRVEEHLGVCDGDGDGWTLVRGFTTDTGLLHRKMQ